MNRLAATTSLAAALALASAAAAQNQPPQAVNGQDEQVNIDKAAPNDQLRIFRSGDKGEFNHYISKVFELKYADPFEIVPHVTKAVEREKGSARTLSFTDSSTGKVRNLVQVVTTPEQMPSVEETIKAIDYPGVVSVEGDLKYSYRLENRRASDIANIIRNTAGTAELKIGADDATNTIYFDDSVSDTARELYHIRYFDVPPPQVEFDVLAVEIDEDKGGDLGLDWDAWKRGVGGQFELTGNTFEGSGSDGFARADSLLVVDATALASFLNYTVQTGTSKVVTRATISASNALPGVVTTMKGVPYYNYATTAQDPKELLEETPGVSARSEQTEHSDSPIGKRPVAIVPPTRSWLTEYSAGTEGLALAIFPTIGTKSVTADVEMMLRSVSGQTKLGTPIISERRTRTTASLRDGQAFNLGGFDRESSFEGRKGIPVLKDIPVLQYLFSTESEFKRHAKLFVVATPHFKSQVLFTTPLIQGAGPADLPPFDAVTWNENTAPSGEKMPPADTMPAAEPTPAAPSGQ